MFASVAVPLALTLTPSAQPPDYHDARPPAVRFTEQASTFASERPRPAESTPVSTDPAYLLVLRLTLADRLVPHAMPASPPRDAALADYGVRSSYDLRTLALKTRTAGHVLTRAATTAGVDAALDVVLRARSVVGVLYPSLDIELTAAHAAAVLETVAAYSDHTAVEAYITRAKAALEAGEISQPPYSLHLEYPQVHRPHPEYVYQPLLAKLSIEGLLYEHERAAAQYRTALRSAAAAALEHVALEHSTQLPTPEYLMNRWLVVSHRRATAILAAVDALGSRYVFAQRGPDEFDCSGLTSYVWGQAGLRLKTYSLAQRDQTDAVELTELLPGDLVFRSDGTIRDSGVTSGHVALALGAGTLVIDASSAAGSVRTATLAPSPSLELGRVRLAEELAATLHTGW